MKQYIFLTAAAATMAMACMKDKGNYEYHPVNEATITLPEEVMVTIGDTLKIYPEIKLTQDPGDGSDTARYSWSWAIEQSLTKVVEFGNTRNYNRKLEDVNVGEYTAVYSIKDKKTGISFQKKFKLTVTTPAYEGFFVLGALGDSSRLDMLAFDGKNAESKRMYTDVLTAFDSQYPRPIGKPIGVYTAIRNNDYQFFISTTTGTHGLDRNSLKWLNTKAVIFMCFGNIPANFAPQLFWSSSNNYVMYDNGNIFTYTPSYLFNLNVPANQVMGEDKTFKASPYFNIASVSVVTYVFMFDTEKRRFARFGLRSNGIDTYASLLNTPSGSKFDFSDVKMDLVWMSRNTSGGNIYAVFKNDVGEYLFSIFNHATGEQSMLQKMNVGAEFATARHMAVDPGNATFYYTNGNKLYAYLPDANRSSMLEDFGEEITYMYFPGNVTGASLYDDYRGKLMVATFNASQPATGGTLRFYSTFAQGNVPQISATVSHGGFAKPAGVAFRSRSSKF